MRGLRDVMDWVGRADTPVYATPYDELAPLYAFERERMRNYQAVAEFVARETPDDARTVGVGACGPGFVLEGVSEHFDTVVGFDLSPTMLELAAERTAAPVVAADLRTTVAPETFDVFTILGGSIAHLPVIDGADSVRAALESAYESLRPGGVFLCDFMRQGALESGRVTSDTFASERFTVERTVITTGEPDGQTDLGGVGRYTFAYEITDDVAGDTVRVGTSTPVREFSVGGLLGATLGAGFADARLVAPPTHGVGIVARKPA
ncbi:MULTISPECIES: class I SAM-dependent methyltransferase [Salinibaculum]|uniref:class I SAM-dependent methyltransferase n=1 Tax=Salinibaculum TaxID=2732368 RepID=UPI0030CCDDDB